MTQPFTRTLRSIDADRSRRGPWVALAALAVLGAWVAWVAMARVPVFAESSEARLERERAVFRIDAPIAGRIQTVRAALEAPVAAGDVLFELDDREAGFARDAEAARAAALEAQIESARLELAAAGDALERARDASTVALREAGLLLETRKLEKRLGEEELARLEELRGTAVSELTISKAHTEVEKQAVAIDLQTASIERAEREKSRDDSDRAARIAALRRELAEREGALADARAAVAHHEREIELHKIRAPAAGSVAELAMLTPGAFVGAGTRLGTVVAAGRVAVEARFVPREALGRVREGQAAEIALDGFPRVEFGAVPLVVERVASEARDGFVRVELALVSPSAGVPQSSIPLEHGLPGRVRVEIERTSPAALLLRSVGRRLSSAETRAGG